MNKKIISSFVTLAMAVNVSVCFSAEKKDVTDPVLREMINSLSTKMPKFINQYGASVFVEDEKITRGALIKALYEYDKKTSGGSGVAAAAVSESGGLTKKQYMALSNRIAALEKNSANTTGGKTKSAASGSVDIVAVMNDLEPNMPMLLDNTLAQSKVFRSLQKKVSLVSSGGNAAAIADSSSVLSKSDSKSILALRKDFAALNKKIDNFEKELILVSDSVNKENKKNSGNDSEIDSKNMLAIKKQFLALNKKMNNFEQELSSVSASIDKGSADKKNSENNSEIDSRNMLAIKKQFLALNKKMNNFEQELSSVSASIDKGSVDKKNSENISENDSKNMLALRKQVVALNKKIEGFEMELASASSLKDKNSKKIKNSDVTASELAEMKATLNQIQKSYVAMSKKVNDLESTQAAFVAPSGKDDKLTNSQMKNINLQIASIKKTVANIPTNDYVDAEIQKLNTQTAKDIKRIENRLNNLKVTENSDESDSKSVSSEGSSKTGTIAKISLGLTMIAALFIAR